MKLCAYLSEYGSMSKLAREIGSHTQSIWHWSTGARPVPIGRCIDIERATGGRVTRKDLRPDDWQKIWPEFDAPVAKKRTRILVAPVQSSANTATTQAA